MITVLNVLACEKREQAFEYLDVLIVNMSFVFQVSDISVTIPITVHDKLSKITILNVLKIKSKT